MSFIFLVMKHFPFVSFFTFHLGVHSFIPPVYPFSTPSSYSSSILLCGRCGLSDVDFLVSSAAEGKGRSDSPLSGAPIRLLAFPCYPRK